MYICVRNLTGQKLKIQKYNQKKKVKSWKIKPKGELYIKARPKEGYIGETKTGKLVFVKKERGIKMQVFGDIYLNYVEINQAGFLEILKSKKEAGV